MQQMFGSAQGQDGGRGRSRRGTAVISARSIFASTFQKYPPLPPGEAAALNRALGRRVQDGRTGVSDEAIVLTDDARAARDELVLRNLRFLSTLAKRWDGAMQDVVAAVTADDVFGIVLQGALRAAERWDPSLAGAASFPTYAEWWVREAIGKARAQNAHVLTTAQAVPQFLRNIRKFRVTFLATHRREPTTAEIADGVGLRIDRVKELLAVAGKSRSLHEPTDHDEHGPTELGELLGHDDLSSEVSHANLGTSPETDYALRRRGEVLEQICRRLVPRDRLLLTYYFGLANQSSRSFSEIAIMLNSSRQTMAAAFRRLLIALREDPATRSLLLELKELCEFAVAESVAADDWQQGDLQVAMG